MPSVGKIGDMDIVDFLRWRGETFQIKNEPDLTAANEIERLRSLVRFQDGVIRSGDVATLTDAERDALEWAVRLVNDAGMANRAATLLDLLERFQKSLSPMSIPLGPEEDEEEGGVWDSSKHKPD